MTLLAFDTEMLPAADRLDAAVECYGRIGLMDVDPADDRFGFSARLHRSTQAVVGVVSVSPCAATRTPSHAADGNEYDVLGIATGPSPVEVRLPGREAFVYGAGEAFLWTGDQAGTSVYRGPSTGLVNIAIPRVTLDAARCDLAAMACRALPASAEFRLLAHAVAGFVRECEALGPQARASAVLHMVDLAIAGLGAKGDAGEEARLRGVRAARLGAIKADIEEHLNDPVLSVGWITGRHRLSERGLRALFADDGTSFSAFVLERRLAMARRMLLDPRNAGLAVGEVAYMAGFGDLSWFNRSFRRRYAMTPSEARAAFAVRFEPE